MSLSAPAQVWGENWSWGEHLTCSVCGLCLGKMTKVTSVFRLTLTFALNPKVFLWVEWALRSNKALLFLVFNLPSKIQFLFLSPQPRLTVSQNRERREAIVKLSSYRGLPFPPKKSLSPSCPLSG